MAEILKMFELVDEDCMAEMQIGSCRIESSFDAQWTMFFEGTSQSGFQFCLVNDLHHTTKDEVELAREFAHAFLDSFAGTVGGVTPINERMRSNFFLPMPFTRRNCSTSRNAPSACRYSTMRSASTGPMPGSASKSCSVALFKSSFCSTDLFDGCGTRCDWSGLTAASDMARGAVDRILSWGLLDSE